MPAADGATSGSHRRVRRRTGKPGSATGTPDTTADAATPGAATRTTGTPDTATTGARTSGTGTPPSSPGTPVTGTPVTGTPGAGTPPSSPGKPTSPDPADHAGGSRASTQPAPSGTVRNAPETSASSAGRTGRRVGPGRAKSVEKLERGLRGLVGAGPSQLDVAAAMRARDAARPTDEDLAAAAELPIVRRHYVPPGSADGT